MTVDPRSRWLISRVLAVVLAALFMALEAAVIAVPGIDWRALMSNPGVLGSAALMSLLAAVRFQGSFEATTTTGPRGPPTYGGPVVGNPAETPSARSRQTRPRSR